MLRSSLFRPFLIAVSLGMVLSALPAAAAQRDDAARGRKYQAPPPTAHIVVTVLRKDNGKPIENAAVVFQISRKGKSEGNMELKSNQDGRAVIDVLPIGDLLQLQIIARGYETYGQDFQINKNNLAIEVHMKLPASQYSIYQKH